MKMLPLRIRLFRGTLKLKLYRHLRSDERERKVPIFKIGKFYIVWRGD